MTEVRGARQYVYTPLQVDIETDLSGTGESRIWHGDPGSIYEVKTNLEDHTATCIPLRSCEALLEGSSDLRFQNCRPSGEFAGRVHPTSIRWPFATKLKCPAQLTA